MSEEIRTRDELIRENEMLKRWISELGAANSRDRQFRARSGESTCHELYKEILGLKSSLKDLSERYHAMLGALPDLLFIQSSDGTYIDYNALSPLQYYVSPRDFLGKKVHEVLPPEVADLAQNCIQEAIKTGNPQSTEYQLETEGENRHYEARIVPCGNNRVLTIVRDSTELKRYERRLREMATHDSLTELPNRVLFQDRLRHAIDRAKRSGHAVALLYMDLDGFKEVNDTCGHETGDRLLVLLSQRLLETVRDNDTVARLGGDEFSIILEEVQSVEMIEEIGERILKVISEPARIEGYDVKLTTSIGVSLWPKDSNLTSELLKKADRAMYIAKRSGKNRLVFWSEEED